MNEVCRPIAFGAFFLAMIIGLCYLGAQNCAIQDSDSTEMGKP